mmetsp:Transcript_9006/g.16981  ORF Transcript_9006/g.16981 Transcript_9006/m.16981 type:complete len:211 (-) Transcript_9006:2479-3111(-)
MTFPGHTTTIKKDDLSRSIQIKPIQDSLLDKCPCRKITLHNLSQDLHKVFSTNSTCLLESFVHIWLRFFIPTRIQTSNTTRKSGTIFVYKFTSLWDLFHSSIHCINRFHECIVHFRIDKLKIFFLEGRVHVMNNLFSIVTIDQSTCTEFGTAWNFHFLPLFIGSNLILKSLIIASLMMVIQSFGMIVYTPNINHNIRLFKFFLVTRTKDR